MSDEIKRSDGLKLIFDDSIIPKMRKYANSLIEESENICTWEYFEGENHSSCGKIYEFAGSNRNQLEFVYCPFCGGKIKDCKKQLDKTN
jgi:hypothetical protein